MIKSTERVLELKAQIDETKKLIADAESHPYYKKFGRHIEKAKDVAEYKATLKKLCKVYYAAIESLTVYLELEKADISEMERELDLQTA